MIKINNINGSNGSNGIENGEDMFNMIPESLNPIFGYKLY